MIPYKPTDEEIVSVLGPRPARIGMPPMEGMDYFDRETLPYPWAPPRRTGRITRLPSLLARLQETLWEETGRGEQPLVLVVGHRVHAELDRVIPRQMRDRDEKTMLTAYGKVTIRKDESSPDRISLVIDL